MKILCTGDWHLRYKKPEMRLDENYFETQAGKIRQIMEIAKGNKCEVILQPGDFFDSVETPWFVVQYYLRLFQEYGIDVVCCPGQHDLKHHTREIENTPLGVLFAARVVSLDKTFDWGEGPTVYASWWGDKEIPPVFDEGKMKIKTTPGILLMHRMVVQKKLWLGQTDFSYARDLLKDHPEFDLFVTGDNHQSFVEESKGRYAVNCGSLMRASIDQTDHRPVVYVYDTDKRNLEEVFLKVAPVGKVLNMAQAQERKERDERLELFISTLKEKGGKADTFDFMDRLYEVMGKGDVDDETKKIVEEALGK